MRTAFVFPGQGAQSVGMGKDFFNNFGTAKRVFEEVNDSLNFNLSKVIFEGPIETLSLTENTQPALMAVSMAIFRVIQEETDLSIKRLCSFVAGHSLGEYTALCAANSISLKDTATLLQVRGKAMQNAVPQGEGAMAAVLGMEYSDVEEVCKKVQGICQIANDNCAGQLVISGEKAAVNGAVSIIKDKGKKAILLNVSAPFHCQLMQPAQIIMKEALEKAKIVQPSVPIITNIEAEATIDSDIIRKNLIQQVTGMVRWRETIDLLLQDYNIQQIVEVGSGKVLTNINKRVSKHIVSLSVSDIDSLNNVIKVS